MALNKQGHNYCGRGGGGMIDTSDPTYDTCD